MRVKVLPPARISMMYGRIMMILKKSLEKTDDESTIVILDGKDEDIETLKRHFIFVEKVPE